MSKKINQETSNKIREGKKKQNRKQKGKMKRKNSPEKQPLKVQVLATSPHECK